MLMPTATLAASTPAAPLIAQNQGVGRVSIAFTRRMPVGKAESHQQPGWHDRDERHEGTHHSPASSNTPTRAGNQNISSNDEQAQECRPGNEFPRCIKLRALRNQTADTGRKNDAEQPDGKPVDRMAEEQRHALDNADLDEHEAKPDQREIQGAQPASEACACRTAGRLGRIMVTSTRIADNTTMMPIVLAASRLPRITPSGASCASLIDATSVKTSWLKKNGLSSVGAVKSMWY